MATTEFSVSPRTDTDHQYILKNAREHPERTYSEHVVAAERIAAEEYRTEICHMMFGGTLDPSDGL